MTQQEHMLMIAVLAGQMQAFATILEILESRQIIEKGDFEAFFSAATMPFAPVALIANVGAAYQQTAQRLGVEVNLKSPPAS